MHSPLYTYFSKYILLLTVFQKLERAFNKLKQIASQVLSLSKSFPLLTYLVQRLYFIFHNLSPFVFIGFLFFLPNYKIFFSLDYLLRRIRQMPNLFISAA